MAYKRRKKYLKLSTPADVRASLKRVANMVINNEIDAKEANAIIYACNTVLSSMRIDEQGKEIEKLQKILSYNGLQ